MRPESTPELIERAWQLVIEKPSISYMQRKLMIGYNHARELMEHFEAEELVSGPNSEGVRTVLQPAAKSRPDKIDRLVEAAISLCEPENGDEKATAYTREILRKRFAEILGGASPGASSAASSKAEGAPVGAGPR